MSEIVIVIILLSVVLFIFGVPAYFTVRYIKKSNGKFIAKDTLDDYKSKVGLSCEKIKENKEEKALGQNILQEIKGNLTKKCPFCAEEIELSAIKCKYCKAFLNANINENAVKSFSCRICGKGQMIESFKLKHVMWPGICCVIISIILCAIAVSSISNIFYESMASNYYIQGYLNENPWISTVSKVGGILFLFGIVFSFVYMKKVHGWKCNYCSNFIKK